MADSKSRKAAAERLRRLDQEYEDEQDKKKRNKLRAVTWMGGRDERREAASTLSGMERQRERAKKLRDGQ